ncbi:MAG: hypothetical protein AAGJ79_07035 [Verrucomicrobiota bacterium]
MGAFVFPTVLLAGLAVYSIWLSYKSNWGIIAAHFTVFGIVFAVWSWASITQPGFYDGVMTQMGVVFYTVLINTLMLPFTIAANVVGRKRRQARRSNSGV